MKKPQIHFRHDRQFPQPSPISHDPKFPTSLGQVQSSHHFNIPPTISTPSLITPKSKQPFKLPPLLSSPKELADNLEQVRSLSPMSVSEDTPRSSPRQLIMHIRSLAPKGFPKLETESLKPSPRKNQQYYSQILEKIELQTANLINQGQEDMYRLDIPVNICETYASNPSSHRLPIIENSGIKNPSFSLNKARKKKKVNKQRAVLRDLTSGVVLAPMKMGVDLNVQPATAIYNSSEGIIRDLLGEADEGDESAFNVSRANNVKQFVTPERMNISPVNKKKPVIKKIKNLQIKNVSLTTNKVDPVTLQSRLEKEQESLKQEEDNQGKNNKEIVSKLRKIVTIAPFLEMQEGNNISKSFRFNIKSPRK